MELDLTVLRDALGQLALDKVVLQSQLKVMQLAQQKPPAQPVPDEPKPVS